ncbi:PAS domain-containing sensor histidine kinase [Sorangium sp. So ce1014]|uniref:sensor histidine kinase n=1 Tax=Sorangium sp. So ce1014 TaxID=3133326 RepID=UPI003F5ED6BB
MGYAPCKGEGIQVSDAAGNLIRLHQPAIERSPLPAVLTVTEEHLVRYANPAFSRLSAIPSGVPAGVRFTSLFRGAEALDALLDRVFRDGVTDVATNVAFSCWEGRVFHGTAIAAPLLDERGLLVQILDTTGQVTGRAREAQAARDLKEANERLLVAGIREQELADEASQRAAEIKALLAAMAEGVTVFGATGEVVLVNPVGRAMLGFSSESPTLDDYRRCDFQHLDGAPLDFEKDVLSRMLRDEPFAELEVLLHAPDGTVRHIVLSSAAVRDARGQVALAMNVYRDVTRIRELEQVREQCTSFITHDLRSPLTAAMFSAQVIEMGRVGHDPQQLAGRIVLSLGRMDEMIRNLLDVQRLNAGHSLLMALGECDLAAIARAAADDLAAFHDQRVVVQGERCARGVWSEGGLRRAIWNLASNALKYGAPGAPVVVTVEKSAERAAVMVHNEGSPIPANEQARLFAPFFRTRASKAGGPQGWGLGLAFVRGCAEAHGGRVTLESDAERGTTFTLELPLDSRPYQDPG